MDVFSTCQEINDHIVNDQDDLARDLLIKLLHEEKLSGQNEYPELVNSLIRQVGLFPYMDRERAHWRDRFVHDLFAADVGGGDVATLHREQSRLLKALAEGKDVAVSAPTSFGKSFVIDAYISMQEPDNVMILVPTIALTDETRRRLYRKFGHLYKVITTPDQTLGSKNIFCVSARTCRPVCRGNR